ncbi:MAG: NAD(P)H-hydrate dehydratase [Fastidiosipilaceae bacterium]
MRTMGRDQQRKLDQQFAKIAGVPTLLLMERAALETMTVCQEILAERGDLPIAVVVGRGNNGGDGYALARMLTAAGRRVTVYETEAAALSHESDGDSDSGINRRAVLNLSIPVFPIGEFDVSNRMVVDCVFGTGFTVRRALDDDLIALFAKINAARTTYDAPVVSVDLPSGVDADSGLVADGAVRATHTVTFVAPKPGILSHPGRNYAGKIIVRGLGIPESFIESVFKEMGGRNVQAITEADLRHWRPERPADGHKGTFGRALILAGSEGMIGAGAMATDGCLRSGAGLVTWALPENVYAIGAPTCPQALVRPLSNDFSSRILACKELIAEARAVLVGPGSGTGKLMIHTLEQAIRNAPRLVIDADGLNCLAESAALRAEVGARIARHMEPAVLTPHPGEFARLFPAAADFPQGRAAAAELLAEQLNSVIVLKGMATVVAMPPSLQTADRIWINTSGNSGLAKGGSGDVLAGLMTGLLAQNLPLGVAVCGAVYLHGRAGDLLRDRTGERAMRPVDLPGVFAEVFTECGWEPERELRECGFDE